MVSPADILSVILDGKTLVLFKTIALATNKQQEEEEASLLYDSHILRSKTKLTHKQYYSRMSRLKKAGLIKRKKGGYYVLTSLGREAHHVLSELEKLT